LNEPKTKFWEQDSGDFRQRARETNYLFRVKVDQCTTISAATPRFESLVEEITAGK